MQASSSDYMSVLEVGQGQARQGIEEQEWFAEDEEFLPEAEETDLTNGVIPNMYWSPSKAGKSPLWQNLDVLSEEWVFTKTMKVVTHRCKHCLLYIRCSKKGNKFISSAGWAHFKTCSRADEWKGVDQRQRKRQAQQNFGKRIEASLSLNNSQSSLDMYTLPQRKISCVTSIAHWFIYSAGAPCKLQLDHPDFRNMLRTFWGGDEEKGKCPVVSRNGLSNFVQSEFEIFTHLLNLGLRKELQFSNMPFGQLLHDGGTLADSKKRVAIGLSYLESPFVKVSTVCIGMTQMQTSMTDENTAKTIRDLVKERSGFEAKDIINNVMSDGAALGVAGRILDDGMQGDTCLMHLLDKVPASAYGLLVRKRANNVFHEGEDLLEKLNSIAKHFSYDRMRRKLRVEAGKIHGFSKKVVNPQVPLNKTRIMTRYHSIDSLLRLHKPIQRLGSEMNVILTEEEWESTTEFWAIGHIFKGPIELVQSENKYLGSLLLSLKIGILDKLRAEEIEVPELSEIKGGKVEDKVKWKNVADFTAAGAECLRRAQLEFERRFCGNNSEVVDGWSSIVVNEKEIMATLLDVRTLTCSHLPEDLRQRAKDYFQNKFEDEYVRVAIAQNETREEVEEVTQQFEEDIDDGEREENGIFDFLTQDTLDEESVNQTEESIREEFRTVYKNFFKMSQRVRKQIERDYKEQHPGLEKVHTATMYKYDISPFYRRLWDKNKKTREFGHLLLMAHSAKGNLTALPAESFCERVYSVGKSVLDTKNSSLDSDMADKIATLRINREWINRMKEKYSSEIKSALTDAGRDLFNSCDES